MPFKPLKHIGPKIGSTNATNSSSLTTTTTAATKADNQQHFSSSSLLESTLNETSNSSSTEPMAPKLPPKPVREQVRVIYGYKAQNEDELTIKEGDIITVISKDNEDMGWWKGELNGRIALFPDNFVEIIQPSPPPPLPRPIVIDKSENVDKFVRVKKPDRIGTSISSSSNEQQQQQTTTTATTISSQTIPVIGKSLKISNGKSSISNVQDNTDVSMITDDVDNGREDPFNQSEPISPSRLVHLTAQRPKIPSNSRRPPSMHLGKSMNDQSNDSYNMDSLDDAGLETANNTVINKKTSLKPTPKPQQQQQQQQQSQMQILESEANLNNSGSSPEKKAPWLSELKKSQERRRTQESSSFGDRKSVINGLSSTTTSSTMSTLSSSSTANSSNISGKPLAPTPPSGKPFVVGSNKSTPMTAMTTTTNTTTTITANNNNINNNNNGTMMNTTTMTTMTLGNVSQSESGTMMMSSSGSGFGPKTSAFQSNNNNNNNSDSMGHDSIIGLSSSSSSNDEIIKLRAEMSELYATVNQLRLNVNDINAQLAANNQTNLELVAQKIDLQKQIKEQQALFDNQKKNLTDMVKELINDLSEAKKKIASLEIEVDRVRKLTTTTV